MTSPLYKVVFHNQSKVYEIYAKQVYESDMMGFIQVEELIFDTSGGTIINPGETKLQSEFKEVKCTYIPIHSIIRIDEVKSQGNAKITEGQQNPAHPMTMPGLRLIKSTDNDTQT